MRHLRHVNIPARIWALCLVAVTLGAAAQIPATAADGNAGEASLKEAGKLAAGGRHDEAARVLERLILANPGNTDLAMTALDSMARLESARWREYALRRQVAISRAGLLKRDDPRATRPWLALLDFYRDSKRLLEADETIEAYGEVVEHDIAWQFLKARLCFEAGSYEAGPRFARILASVSADHSDPKARQVWHDLWNSKSRQAYMEVAATYEALGGRLAIHRTEAESIQLAEQLTIATNKPLESLVQLDDLANEDIKESIILPGLGKAHCRPLNLLLDDFFSRQPPATRDALRAFQEEQFQRITTIQDRSAAGAADCLRLFRRLPWSRTAQLFMLKGAWDYLWSGQAALARRSFREVLDHAADGEVISEARGGLWLALDSDPDTTVADIEASFTGIDPEAVFPWKGSKASARTIKSGILADVQARTAPPRPATPPLASLRQGIPAVPDVPPWPTSTQRWDPGLAPKLGLHLSGNRVIVSSPNLLGIYGKENMFSAKWMHAADRNFVHYFIAPGESIPCVSGNRLFARWGYSRFPLALAAFDLDSGNLLWTTSQHPFWQLTTRRNPSVLSPLCDPVMKAGRLYVQAGIVSTGISEEDLVWAGGGYKRAWHFYPNGAGTVMIVCMNPENGAVLWSRNVESMEARGFDFALNAGLHGNAVTVSGGAIYSSLNAGRAVRCDARDGRIEWVHYYPRGGSGGFDGISPIVSGDLVILAPRDYNGLLVVDKEQGSLVWQTSFLQPQAVLGVNNGRLLAHDGHTLAAFDVRTGKCLWHRYFEKPLVGSGVLRGDFAVVGTQSELLQIATGDGRTVESLAWNKDGRFLREFTLDDKDIVIHANRADKPFSMASGQSLWSSDERGFLFEAGKTVEDVLKTEESQITWKYWRESAARIDGFLDDWKKTACLLVPPNSNSTNCPPLMVSLGPDMVYLAVAYPDSQMMDLGGSRDQWFGEWLNVRVSDGDMIRDFAVGHNVPQPPGNLGTGIGPTVRTATRMTPDGLHVYEVAFPCRNPQISLYACLRDPAGTSDEYRTLGWGPIELNRFQPVKSAGIEVPVGTATNENKFFWSYRTDRVPEVDGRDKDWTGCDALELPPNEKPATPPRLYVCHDQEMLVVKVDVTDPVFAPLLGTGRHALGDWLFVSVADREGRRTARIGIGDDGHVITDAFPQDGGFKAAVSYDVTTTRHIYELSIPAYGERIEVYAQVRDQRSADEGVVVTSWGLWTLNIHTMTRRQEQAVLALCREMPDLPESRLLYDHVRAAYQRWPIKPPAFPRQADKPGLQKSLAALKPYLDAFGQTPIGFSFFKGVTRAGGVEALPANMREWYTTLYTQEKNLDGPHELDSLNAIVNWVIIGPFANPGRDEQRRGLSIDYLREFGGEFNHIPAHGMELAFPPSYTVKSWQRYKSPESMIEFYKVRHLNASQHPHRLVTYSACWIDCESDMDIDMKIGSDDGYKLYLDNRLLGRYRVARRSAKHDSEIYPLHLTQGRHFLMVKVENRDGLCRFILRLTTPKNERPKGITVWY